MMWRNSVGIDKCEKKRLFVWSFLACNRFKMAVFLSSASFVCADILSAEDLVPAVQTDKVQTDDVQANQIPGSKSLKTGFFKGISQKISNKFLGSNTPSRRGQTQEKGDVRCIVIKGGDVRIEIEGKDSSKIDINTTGQVSLNKKQTCLIIEGKKNEKISGKIVVPHGIRIVIECAHVFAKLHNVVADLRVSAGEAELLGDGKFSKLELRAGKATIKLKGLMGDTSIYCAQGMIDLAFQKESFEKIDNLMLPEWTGTEMFRTPDLEGKKRQKGKGRSRENPYTASGLQLHQPAAKIYIHLAQGQAQLFFPPNAGIGYPKNSTAIASFVRHQSKRPSFRIFSYSVDASARIMLRYADEKDEAAALNSKTLNSQRLENNFVEKQDLLTSETAPKS